MKNFSNLEGKNIEKNISNQMKISAYEKVEIFDINSKNLNISQEKIKISSKILLTLIKNSEENLAEFVSEMVVLKNNNNENLEKIGKLFSQKIDYLIFLYEKISEFDELISKYQIEDLDDFNDFIDELDEDFMSEKLIIFQNFIKVSYSLEEFFLEDENQIKFIFKENISKIEEFIRESFFESEKAFYRDEEYLQILKLIKKSKIVLNLNLTDFRLELLEDAYYCNSDLVEYLDKEIFLEGNNFLEANLENQEELIYILNYVLIFLSNENENFDKRLNFLKKFIDEHIYNNLEILLEFLEKNPDINSEFFKKIVDEINYYYSDKKHFLENYLKKYNLNGVFH